MDRGILVLAIYVASCQNPCTVIFDGKVHSDQETTDFTEANHRANRQRNQLRKPAGHNGEPSDEPSKFASLSSIKTDVVASEPSGEPWSTQSALEITAFSRSRR